jgi:hypothetical protein
LVAREIYRWSGVYNICYGSYDQPDDITVYQPVERVFNEKLPDHEKFLSFDRLWDTYENEKAGR